LYIIFGLLNTLIEGDNIIKMLDAIKWWFYNNETRCKSLIGKTVVFPMNTDNPFKEQYDVYYKIIDVQNGYCKYKMKYSNIKNIETVESSTCDYVMLGAKVLNDDSEIWTK
jgi:hypothetical protein